MKPAFLATGLMIAAQSAAAQGLLPYTDTVRTTKGATLYADNCAACHGADLSGEQNWRERDADGYLPAPPHDVTGHTWHHPDEMLIRIVTVGTEALVGGGYKSNMIGFGDQLGEDDILDVLAYIKSTWPDQVIEMHNQINARTQ